MGILNFGKRVGGAVGRKTASGMVGFASSRAGMASIALGAAGIGMANTVAPAVRDAAFDVAMGDPNADAAFTGRKIDSRFLVGRAMGGFGGGLLQATSPEDALSFNSVATAPVNLYGSPARGGIGLGIGAATGGIIGKFAGGKRGAMIGAGIGGFLGGTGGMGSVGSAPFVTAGGTVGGAVAGGMYGFKRGVKKGIVGTLGGAVAGTLGGGAISGAMIAGSVAPPLGSARQMIENNQQFFSESPYARNSSRGIASQTNASGDIVLGMHNSRRGY
jgi:hypothetical protein